MQKYKLLLISIIIVIVAAGALFFLYKLVHKRLTIQQARTNQQTTMMPHTNIPTPSPVITPLTQQNAQPTLQATEQSLQQAINQENSDLQQVGQINANNDNVTGL
ncbi:MAG TPA: hypothetical protein VGT05_04160 [Patescibacteria group bacterium]|nr:hypothetical protein [Patescibacteria group bacterium]